MATFDRFTKALALGNFRQAYKVLVGDEEGTRACNTRSCHSDGDCPLHRCICFTSAGICVLT